jgi:hypothetical protein
MNNTATISDKIRENRLRRAAERQGLALSKSRRRDPNALDFGCYVLVNPMLNAIVFGAASGRYDQTLDDIEAYLEGPTS